MVEPPARHEQGPKFYPERYGREERREAEGRNETKTGEEMKKPS